MADGQGGFFFAFLFLPSFSLSLSLSVFTLRTPRRSALGRRNYLGRIFAVHRRTPTAVLAAASVRQLAAQHHRSTTAAPPPPPAPAPVCFVDPSSRALSELVVPVVRDAVDPGNGRRRAQNVPEDSRIQEQLLPDGRRRVRRYVRPR